MTMLRNFLNAEDEKIPWDAIKFMIGVINYGGRVTDPMDNRLLVNMLTLYVNP